MKKITLLLLISTKLVFSQEISLNQENNFYEFSKIVESKDSLIFDKFYNRLKAINVENVQKGENQISGDARANHLVMGFATVEILYKIKISFKEGKYKLTTTGFIIKSHNGANPLEGMGAYKGMWINKINKKLPDIIKNIENLTVKSDW